MVLSFWHQLTQAVLENEASEWVTVVLILAMQERIFCLIRLTQTYSNDHNKINACPVLDAQVWTREVNSIMYFILVLRQLSTVWHHHSLTPSVMVNPFSPSAYYPFGVINPQSWSQNDGW